MARDCAVPQRLHRPEGHPRALSIWTRTMSTNRRPHRVETPTGISLSNGALARCDPTEGCATCKLAKLPRPGPYRRADPNRHHDLDVHAYISTDISGPLSPESVNGYRYIIIFIDRSSGFSHVFFMRRKSEAVGMLNEFLDDVKQMNKSPKHMTIKSDAEA
eukprot:3674132-Pyramimonas_sp.AAC.1